MPAKINAIKWTVSKASTEFGLDSKTITKRLKALEVDPNSKVLTTKQICAAIFGDMAGQKLRETTHRANLLAIEEKQEIGELIPRINAVRLWSEVIALLREKIMGTTRLTEDERRDILAGLRDIPPTEYFRDDREIEETEA